MADYAPQLIKAVVATLKADAGVVELVGTAVFTDVPQRQEFPYLRVSSTSEPFAANDFSGQQHTVRVQCFSRKAGIKECLLVRAAVMAALDRQEGSILLDAGTLIKCEYTGVADAFIEDDGKTWQSVIEFDVITM